MVKLVKIIHYKHDGSKSKFQSITVEKARKRMIGKGGYTESRLNEFDDEKITNLWNRYIHTAFID